MARKRTAEIGHNVAPLSNEDQADLEALFASRIRLERHKLAEAQLVVKGHRDNVNGLFAQIKAELLTSRKDFEDLLEQQDKGEAEFAAWWAKRAARYARHGLPVGQLDLFGSEGDKPDAVDDQQVARLDGRRAGARSADPVPPSYIAPIMQQAWLDGWHEGREEQFTRVARGEKLLASRELPSTAEPVDLNDDEDPLDPDAVDDAARKLKRSGFMTREAEVA